MASLFGTPASSGAATAGATNSTSGMGLFSNLNTGGANNNSNATAANTLGGSLFGNLGASTNKPAATGLFANLGNTPQPSANTGGLFGQTNTSQPHANTGGSIFGAAGPTNTSTNLANTCAPAPGASLLTDSLFGSTVNPTFANTNAAPPTGAFFDSLLAKSKRQQHDGDNAMLDDLPALQLGLGDLRQRLKNLGPRKPDGDRSAGRNAHYLLAASGIEPGSAVRDLGSLGFQSSRFDRSTHTGQQGEVDVETYLSNLQNKTTLSMIADGLERSVRDFDAFLEDNVTMEWEAQRKRIYQHFGITPKQTTGVPDAGSSGQFGHSRRKAPRPSSPSLRSTTRGSTFGRSALGKSVIGTPSRIGSHASQFADVSGTNGDGAFSGSIPSDDRFARDKQLKLADKIHNLNDARQHGSPYPIFNELGSIAASSGDRHAEQLADAYSAMMDIVGENPDAEDATAHERQYASSYLDPNSNSVHAIAVRKQTLAGASKFLERKFMDMVEQQITKNPHQAQLGGRPDVLSKIKAYVRLLNTNKHLAPDISALQSIKSGEEQEFVWAVIFYLLRSGHVTEAVQYVNDNQNLFRAIDRSFPGFINSYATEERRLRRQLQDRCNTEYSQRIRNAHDNTIDPFRAACYKIIGRCDLSNRSFEGFNADVNDWIWLQFNLAREGDRSVEIAGETFGLSEVQATIKEVGQKYFPKNAQDDANGNFGMYFFMQILSGMFEQAVAYLYSFAYVDAVHFAIALEYYGLLRASDGLTNELLSHSTRGLPQIAFGRMLGYYTRDFRAANVAAAVDYIVLMCLNQDDPSPENGAEQVKLCYEALRELVLETREFSKLIGDIRPDGQRIPGIIERRGSLLDLKRDNKVVWNITLQAARFANDNGRTTDAVLLYHLAEDYDTVVNIVGRAVSEVISLEIGGEQMRLDPVKPRADGAQAGSSLSLAAIEDPIELARTMTQMYEGDRLFRNKIQDINRTACNVLLQMAEIKRLVAAGQWMGGLDLITQLDILPLAAKGDPTAIRVYAAKFNALPQSVSANVGNLLMWTVICCTQQRERLVTGQYAGNEGTSRELQTQLKQMCIDLTAYTSHLRYRFPSSLLEALARASAD
ncbi:unnamed protein product [Discula destructiva]